jgi:hypothetical protein
MLNDLVSVLLVHRKVAEFIAGLKGIEMIVS